MHLSHSLRTAIVSLSLFSGALVANAQPAQHNVQKLLTSPVISFDSIKKSGYSDIAQTLLSKPGDKSSLALLAPQLETTANLLEITLFRMVASLEMHLDPAERIVAMQSILATGLGDAQQGKKLLDKLPQDNVVVHALNEAHTDHKLFQTSLGWGKMVAQFWNIPSFNVQRAMASPGIKTLQSMLTNPCAQVVTSVSFIQSNDTCAKNQSFSTQDTVNIIKSMDNVEGLLVGEYDGIPVLAAHNPDLALGAAAMFQLDPKKPNSVVIVLSMALLDGLKNAPDVLAFIIEHEKAHIAHKHQLEGKIENEVQADATALKSLSNKGMSQQRLQTAYGYFERNFGDMLPAGTSSRDDYKAMMAERHQKMHKALHEGASSSASPSEWSL